MKCARGHDLDDCPCVEEEVTYWQTYRTVVFVAVLLLAALAAAMGGWRFA